MRPRGSLHCNGATTDDSFVDIAVASFAEELPVGEAIGGSFEVTVVELLDLDGFVFVWF